MFSLSKYRPKDAVRAIRRRLQNAGKNHVVCMHTLTVNFFIYFLIYLE